MSFKESVLALVDQLKLDVTALVEDVVSPEVATLQAQVADLEKKNSDLQATYDALVIKDGELTQKEASEAATIEKIKADLAE